MIDYFTPFKLFALWLLACWLLWRKIQTTVIPEPEPDTVDRSTVDRAVDEAESRERYNVALVRRRFYRG